MHHMEMNESKLNSAATLKTAYYGFVLIPMIIV